MEYSVLMSVYAKEEPVYLDTAIAFKYVSYKVRPTRRISRSCLYLQRVWAGRCMMHIAAPGHRKTRKSKKC